MLARRTGLAFSRSAVSGATFSSASTKEMREEPEQPVKLPHLHNLGLPAYLELSGTMVGRAGLHLWRGSRFCYAKKQRGAERMKRFLVTYLAPASVIAEWKKTDPAQRRDAETKMQGQWKKWMADNAKMFVDVGAGGGKTKLGNTRGKSETKNEPAKFFCPCDTPRSARQADDPQI